MQRRSLLLLVAAGTVAVVLALVAIGRGDREISRAPPGEPALPGLAARLGDLAWLRLSRGAMRVNFAVVNGRWSVVEKGNYPAAAERVRRLLLGLADLTLVEPKTDRSELLARLDLDDPSNGKSTEIALQDRTGEALGALIIGRRRPDSLGGGDAGVYVRRPGSDQAWLARGAFDLAGDATSWLDRRILDLAPARIATVVLTAADGTALVLNRASADLPFAVDGAPADAKLKGPASLAAPAAALEALDLVDVRPAAEMPIATAGVATAAFTTFDGLVVGLRLMPPGGGDWVAIDATGFGPGAEAAKPLSARLSRWSFAVPAETAKLLRTILADLRRPADGS